MKLTISFWRKNDIEQKFFKEIKKREIEEDRRMLVGLLGCMYVYMIGCMKECIVSKLTEC